MHARVEQALSRHTKTRLTEVDPRVWAGWFERFLANAGLSRPGLEVDEEVLGHYFFGFAFHSGASLEEAARAWEYFKTGRNFSQSVDSQTVERVVESEVSE